jgi:DMSO/TMAO reductase YedYZ molybdopterin-dependent catalytic subunit
MNDALRFLDEHVALTRRSVLRWASAAGVAVGFWPRNARGEEAPPALRAALDKLESYLTLPDKFQDVSRGKPLPHALPDEKKREVGLTRDTWQLEVVSDPDHAETIRKPLSKAAGTAIDFPGLLRLGEKHAVRFAKVMTCLNLGCPLGMGIWEGVPLRELVWMTRPRDTLRRAFYYGYHNDDPAQMFQSSLPIGRVFEDPFDLPPVIVCYKLNGQWLPSERGGPVRIVVPEAYGFKCIKWLSRVVLTNLAHANDTYAKENNDIDSPLKTFAATLLVPRPVRAGEPFAVTGYAQVGIGGLSKVETWIQPASEELPADDPNFETAPWREAKILPAPEAWGGGLPDGRMPEGTLEFDSRSGRPMHWPLRLTKAHWAALLPPLAAGKYTLRCRAVDEKGHAQPMPRPFRKSGHAAIESVALVVE